MSANASAARQPEMRDEHGERERAFIAGAQGVLEARLVGWRLAIINDGQTTARLAKLFLGSLQGTS